MNVFENLIEELKEENLIEETVIESNLRPANESGKEAPAEASAPESSAQAADSEPFEEETPKPVEEEPTAEPALSEPENENSGEEISSIEDVTVDLPAPSPQSPSVETLNILPPLANRAAGLPCENSVQDNEFFRRRAMEEVSALQSVEHVISGVEREQLKVLPKTFNDLAVSKALHDFLQISKNGNGQENAQAEFKLMQETESWYSALSHRDKNISVGDLRRYCETTKPALSTQALTALARFYRNSPYSETVRAKFDMVVTRLLTREVKDDKRELTLGRDELIAYLGELYANWSSITLYAPDDDSEILITTLKFEDFMTEAESAADFEELIRSDFFDRLRMFKESAGENFYAPLVTATAVESNVRVGNRWVDLIRSEREKADVATLEEKYGYLLDQTVSDVTSKSVQLAELLKIKNENAAKSDEKKEKLNYEASAYAKNARSSQEGSQSRVRSFFALNKWLLAGLVLTIIASASMIVWVDYLTPQTKTSPNVKKVNLENSSLKDDLKAARINAEIFYGVVQPSWDAMPEQKKEELLKKLYSVGGEKGYKQVQLMNAEGRTVGYASEKTISVNN